MLVNALNGKRLTEPAGWATDVFAGLLAPVFLIEKTWLTFFRRYNKPIKNNLLVIPTPAGAKDGPLRLRSDHEADKER